MTAPQFARSLTLTSQAAKGGAVDIFKSFSRQNLNKTNQVAPLPPRVPLPSASGGTGKVAPPLLDLQNIEGKVRGQVTPPLGLFLGSQD